MGIGWMKATKYFLFLFNLLFFLFGGLIMGFALWLLLDNQSFIAVLKDSSMGLKVASYIFIGVGAFTMLLGLLGCLGAVCEIQCLLGLYFTCLLLILVAQVVAGTLIYFKKDLFNDEMSKIVTKVLHHYPGKNSTTEQAWDFVQWTMECCGWRGSMDWNENMIIINSSNMLFPCSCQNMSLTKGNLSSSGFCEAETSDWPVYEVGCSTSVEQWVLTNLGVMLAIGLGVAVFELLGMVLSICLCKNIHKEDYTKVPNTNSHRRL